MTHDFRPLRDRLEQTLGELLGHRPYIVLMAETAMTPYRNSQHSFSAITSPFLHRALREDIGARWTGPGPAMLVDADPLAETYSDPGSSVTHFTSIVCHEAGHIATFPGLFAPDDFLPDTDNTDRRFFRREVESPDTFYAPAATRSRRIGHGPDWIRATLHIGHRLRQRGFDLTWPMTIDQQYYGYSPAISYFRALAGECDRLIGVPLTAIAMLPIPKPFLDLWQSDLAKWPDV